jgi:hypothetical protein
MSRFPEVRKMTRTLLLPLLAGIPMLLRGQIYSVSEAWTSSASIAAPNTLVQRDALSPTGVVPAATDVLGVALNAGMSGHAIQVARYGQAPCVFQGVPTHGDFAVMGNTTLVDCMDGGSSLDMILISTRVVGYILQDGGSGSTVMVELTPGLMGTSILGVPNLSTLGSVSAGAGSGTVGCLNLYDTSGPPVATSLCSPMTNDGDLLLNGTTPLLYSGGPLGTPSGGTLTNATGLPLGAGVTATFTSPLTLSTNTLSITGAAGQVLAGSGPAFTATPTLGVAGTSLGSVAFANTTSGSVTVEPVSGALGTAVLSLPAATGTFAVSASSPITESSAGAIGCGTCVTSATSLTSNAVAEPNEAARIGDDFVDVVRRQTVGRGIRPDRQQFRDEAEWHGEGCRRNSPSTHKALVYPFVEKAVTEEIWVSEPAGAYGKQDIPLMLSAFSFLTETHNVQRLR